MEFQPKKTKNKKSTSYKTIYISDELLAKLNKMANDYGTSFNNIVISIIERFFNEMEDETED